MDKVQIWLELVKLRPTARPAARVVTLMPKRYWKSIPVIPSLRNFWKESRAVPRLTKKLKI
jgi:hypothetical protein